MKDIDEIRRSNMRLLEKEFGGLATVADRVGMSPSQFGNLRDGAKDSKTGKPRGMRKATARRIEEAAGKPAGWLDTDHSQSAETKIVEPPVSPLLRAYEQASPGDRAIVDVLLGMVTQPRWLDTAALMALRSLRYAAEEGSVKSSTAKGPAKAGMR
ncbi:MULTISPECIES: hypothetical protein [unclassified Pseudomonas]|uniref:hypothetical protein n=1 Tax=unclassified Pseudomonas TaxID=196821 RepID=UPI00244B3D55|nr:MULTISPECIES: hypothetical protein [unclassified Pseudomonas]MDG9927441.1 hypothetical protein [Pseudomonas sp. GD04042]MDH0482510.1 hypothetical protein [Pseudomonas sp. GD04015]MDH0602862.1 hypothetical protein [Pseudomonas sp. GD03869]